MAIEPSTNIIPGPPERGNSGGGVTAGVFVGVGIGVFVGPGVFVGTGVQVSVGVAVRLLVGDGEGV